MRHIIGQTIIVFLIIGIIVSSGCSVLGKKPLDGTEWLLSGWSVSSLDPLSFEITAKFVDGAMSGRSAVNTYKGAYEAGSGASFKAGSLARTEMAGPEPAMRAEEIYFKLLEQSRTYKINKGELRLYDANGNELLIFSAD